MTFRKLEQFAPDVDPTTPGIIIDATNIVPTIKGYTTGPAATDPGFDAAAAAVLKAAVVRKLDNTTRFVIGLTTKLYELSGSSWVDVSRSVGGAYNATTDVRWDFAQFGNVTLATNKADTLQYSSSSNFADVSGAPKAKLIETVNQFVMIADTDDGSFGDSPDRWWCCAIGDYTDWTPDTSTQCASGRLTSAPGRINALKRLGDGIVAYKDRAMFIGSYVGAPEVWSFQEIPGQIGCLAQGGVVDIGAAHVFCGYDNFYLFDGSRPTPIGNPIRDWFYDQLYTDYAYRMRSLHDRTNSNVYFFYPSKTGSGELDSCVVYNHRTDKWGTADRDIEAIVDYVSAGLTFAGSFATGTTFDTVESGLTWDSPLLVTGQPAPAYIGTDHKVYLLTASGGSWSMTTGDVGDDSTVSVVTRIRPRFITAPDSATLSNYYRMVLSDSLSSDAITNYGSGKFDFIRAARWHRFVLAGSGDMEITGMDVQGLVAGSE